MMRGFVPVVLAAAAGVASGRPEVSPRADALDLVLLGGPAPVRVEVRVEIDGKPVPAVWDETFAKLHAFHDRDGNGSLDAAEAARLPAAFGLRQVLWGQFVPAGPAPPFAELDADASGSVSTAELADYYRRCGLGGVLVGVGKPPATDRLTDALLKRLDTNRDGAVTEAEWKAAADTLRPLDANDDELIGPGELVEHTAYPGALGSVLLTVPDPAARPHPVMTALPLVVLPLRTADTHWAAALAVQSKGDAGAMKALRTTAAASWQVRFGDGAAPPPRLTHTAGPTQLELRADPGKLGEQAVAARKRTAALFAECDADADGGLNAAELASPKGTPFRLLAAVADRDGNGQLSATEFTAWLDLQDQVAKGHVLLTVLDHGNGLFERLDADRDGALSVRELRGAWERVGRGFDRSKLPRHLFATVSRGQPRELPGRPARTGPAWFVAMDRNGDGDVSRREFTGPAAVFERLDADRDGLLDPREAAAAANR
jgi:Ca2+-binding EF-hand superfamily protein